MSTVQDRHLQRLSQHLQSVPVTFILPSFYLLPSNPCNQPVCVLDTVTRVLPYSQGRNLSAISNNIMATSHYHAAWLEKRVKSLHRNLDKCCPEYDHGNPPMGAVGTKLGIWALLWHPGAAACGLAQASPEVQLLQCHWVNSNWANFTALITKYYCGKSSSVEAAYISWTAAKSS